MEVKLGYKQTNDGMIPEDWNVCDLRNCCSKITDGTHDTPRPARSGVPFLTAIHVKGDGIDFDACLFVTEADHAIIYRRCNPVRNDVLMVNIGAGVATTALVKVDYEFSLKNVALLKPDSRRIFGPFLQYSLSHRKPKITQDLSSGGAQPFLSLTQIGRIEIPLPPNKAEQEAIAGAISDADSLIESLERLIAKKRQIKLAAMQELLTGKRRLQGFSGEWETKRLVELCTLKSGESITARNICDVALYPCYGGNGLRGFTTRFTHEGKYSLIGRVGALCGNVRKVEGKFFASEHAIVVSAFAQVDVGWLTLALGTLELNRRAESSAQPVLTVSKLLMLEVSSPPAQDEQRAIAAIFSDMDAEIATVETKLYKARQIKQGMMQELLTGRIRLI